MRRNMTMTKKKRVLVCLCMVAFLFGLPVASHAQKKELIAAKDQVKAGKDLGKAQASMETLLKDSTNHRNKKIWTTLFDAVRKQYEQGNEKLYLKQAYDTAQLFNLAKQLFVIAERFDSIEMIPGKKGKLEIEFRKAHGEYLNRIRPNIYNGGAWFLHKQKYADAYQFFDLYIECASQPLFHAYQYRKKDKNLSTAAYWAVYAGYKMQDSKATLHHSYEALKDTVHYNYMLQYLAETYKLDGDTARYVATLKEGFARAPKFPFFFPRLVEYYSDEGKMAAAMEVVDSALTVDADNEAYLFAKSTLLLNQGSYKDCIAVCDKIISRDSEMAEVYYNAGLAYFNMAVELDKNRQVSRKRTAEMKEYYEKALPYLEKYRSLAPDKADQWALPLYTIYLNLNMGKEFDEIDKLMNTKRR